MNNVGRPRKYTDAKLFEEKVNKYFDWCDSENREVYDKKGNKQVILKPYTVSGLCLYLDLTRETLCQYEKEDNFSDAIKRAKKRIENWIEEHSLTREIDTASAIFNLKNNFGWTDKQELYTQNNNINQNAEITADEAKKFLDEMSKKFDK